MAVGPGEETSRARQTASVPQCGHWVATGWPQGLTSDPPTSPTALGKQPCPGGRWVVWAADVPLAS